MNAYQDIQTSGIRWPNPTIPFLLPSQEIPHRQHPQQPPPLFQDLERQMAEFAAEQEAILNDLRKYYVFPSDSSVTSFLSEHRAIPQILLAAVPHLQGCFGNEAIFSLSTPLDESGSRTLYASVMWPGPSQDVRNALARFDEEWWMERAGQGAGYLTFTYQLT
jgi:hypothetical protein